MGFFRSMVELTVLMMIYWYSYYSIPHSIPTLGVASVLLFSVMINRKLSKDILQVVSHNTLVLLTISSGMLLSFLCIGSSVFLENEYITKTSICTYILNSLLTSYISLAFFSLLYYFDRKIAAKTKKSPSKGLFIGIFVLMSMLLMIICAGYYPGNMGSDGPYLWIQGQGNAPIIDNHPALYALFLRLCYHIYPNIFTCVVVQVVLFSLICSAIFSIFYCYGVNKYILLLIATLIAVSSNTYMMISLISKNSIYTIILLANFLCIIIMLANPERYMKNYFYIICWAFLISLQHIIRHNGFLATYFLIIAILAWGIYNRRYIIHIGFLVLVVSIMISFIKGPLYDYYDVISYTSKGGMINPLIGPVGLFLKNGEEIPDDINEIVFSVGDAEKWIENYDAYDSDKLSWSDMREGIKSLSIDDGMHIYISLLRKNPYLVIKDRLTKTDMLWNMTKPKDVYLYKYSIGVYCIEEDYCSQYIPEAISGDKKKSYNRYYEENRYTVIGKTINKYVKNSIFDILMYRNGIWLYISIILILYNLIVKRSFEKCIPFIGVLGIFISLMLTIGFQIYEYIWFYNVLTIMYAIYTISNKKVLIE